LHIAEAAWEELNDTGQHRLGRDEVAAADWIERHTVQNQALVTALLSMRHLHTGFGAHYGPDSRKRRFMQA